MTILTCWLEPERALVAVDTQSAEAGRRYHCSKLIPFVHANAILAGRGWAALLNSSYCMANNIGADDIEGLDHILPGIINSLFAQIHAQVPRELQAQCEQELYLVGWSRKRARMYGREFVRARDSDSFVTREVPMRKWAGGPWDESMDALPDPSRPDTMLQLVRAQARYMKAAAPLLACGGRAVIVELTRDRMTIQQGGTL